MAIKKIVTIDAVSGRAIGYDTDTGDIVFLDGDTITGRIDGTGFDPTTFSSGALAVTGEITGSAGLEVATGLVVGFDGTVTADRMQLGDAAFYLNFDGTSPSMQFDSGDYILYTRGSNLLRFFIASAEEQRLTSSGLAVANGVYVGDATGTPTDNDIRCEGALHAGSATSGLQTDKVSLTATEIKALAASPKQVVAAPGATEWVEFIAAELVLNAGSEALTESNSNMRFRRTDGAGTFVSEAIEATGFIDQTSDTRIWAGPTAQAAEAMSAALNKSIVLDNAGASEYDGNASDDATLDVYITYRVHTTA